MGSVCSLVLVEQMPEGKKTPLCSSPLLTSPFEPAKGTGVGSGPSHDRPSHCPGLEPEIQKLMAKHREDIRQLKLLHEAELLQSDERAAQHYGRQAQELRGLLEREKEEQSQRERERARQRCVTPGSALPWGSQLWGAVQHQSAGGIPKSGAPWGAAPFSPPGSDGRRR